MRSKLCAFHKKKIYQDKIRTTELKLRRTTKVSNLCNLILVAVEAERGKKKKPGQRNQLKSSVS